MSEHEEEDAVEAYYRLNHPERYAEMKEKKATREQRRYEIARAVFAANAARPDAMTKEKEARSAVDWADALLAELDKPRAEAEK